MFDEIAVLRNHPPPDAEKQKRLLALMSDCRIKFDSSSSKKLHETLQQIAQRHGEEVMATVSMLVMKCGMKPAKYYSCYSS